MMSILSGETVTASPYAMSSWLSQSTAASKNREYRNVRVWFAIGSVCLLSLIQCRRYQDGPTLFLLESGVDGMEMDNKSTTTPRTRRMLSPPKVTPAPTKQVHFLHHTDLDTNDGFSASWLQSRESFLRLPLDAIETCEDAYFVTYSEERAPNLRMTLDWMDWSVEHLSPWGKIVQWDLLENNDIPYQTISNALERYLQRGTAKIPLLEKSTTNSLFHNTIAVIAFRRYESDKRPEEAHQLTVKTTAATIESLRRAGFGRVVVSVVDEEAEVFAHDALQYLLQQLDPTTKIDKNSKKKTAITVGHTEVAFAHVNRNDITTTKVSKNMPRATMMALSRAFQDSVKPSEEQSKAMKAHITSWLGDSYDPSYWNYVYLTEPDTILQGRHAAFPALKAQVDKGAVVIPHRMQSIPHEFDLPGMNRTWNNFLFTDEFPNVLNMDPTKRTDDVCCDENAGPNFKPGRAPYFEECGRGEEDWYNCGFLPKNKDQPDRHARIKAYKLIRLETGTNLTMISSNAHGRRCIPQRKKRCRPFAASLSLS